MSEQQEANEEKVIWKKQQQEEKLSGRKMWVILPKLQNGHFEGGLKMGLKFGN